MKAQAILRFQPMVYWVAAIVEIFILRNWWHKGQTGADWYAIGAVAVAILIVRQIFLGFRARDQQIDVKRRDEARMTPSSNLGDAKWATTADVVNAGLAVKDGLHLGKLGSTELRYAGPGNLLTVAPPRSGKGVSLVIPNLLTCNRSMIVLDPKGELFFATSRHRREKLGHKTITLCPWSDKLGAEFGIPIKDHQFNPLSFLKRGPDIKDDCEMVSTLLLPSKGKGSDTEEFWMQSGRDILTATMLHEVSKYGKVTLPRLRQVLFMTPQETSVLLAEMIRNTDFCGSVSEYGKKLVGVFTSAPKQWQGQISTAQNKLSIYDTFGPLANHVSAGEIDWKAVKETPTTIYMILPGDRMASHAAWLNLVLSIAIEMLARVKSDKIVTILLDEVGNVGAIPMVPRALNFYGGMGIQLWAFLQNTAQWEILYGKEGLENFLSSAAVLSTFNTNNLQTAKMISELIGDRTFVERSTSDNPNPNDGSSREGFSYAEKGAPLIRPEEVRMMGEDEQIIIVNKVRPIRGTKVKYYEHPEWRKRADRNPYVTIENL